MDDQTQSNIKIVTDNLCKFLLEKNKRYGSSYKYPLKIFSSCLDLGEVQDDLCRHIDEKLSRIKESFVLRKNDTVDLTGYLILLCIEQGWFDFNDLID